MGSLSIKLLFVFIFVMFLSSSVLAITGAIGNGKMVLNGEVGDILEKSILVINNNNISVNISVYALGDLLDYIDILDEEFVLLPNERKKAYFRVELTQPGTFNPRINVKFTSTNESGGGVGLTSNIIIRCSK